MGISHTKSGAPEWKMSIRSHIEWLTARAINSPVCPLTIEQMQGMLLPAEDYNKLYAAAKVIPRLFTCDRFSDSFSVRFTHPGTGEDYVVRVQLPFQPINTPAFGKHVMLRPLETGDTHHCIIPEADPEHVRVFAEWAAERHLLGLKVASVRKLVEHLAFFSSTPGQLVKAWPQIARYADISADGTRARFLAGWDAAKYRAPIAAANGLLAMCSLLPKEPSKEWAQSPIKGCVNWHSKSVKNAWDGIELMAV